MMAASATAMPVKPKKAAPSFGFSKGFLLSSPSKKKKKKPEQQRANNDAKPSSSSALLGFEGEEQPTLTSMRDEMLLVTDDPSNNKYSSNPAIIEVNGNEENEVETCSDTRPSHIQKEENDFGIQEVASSSRSPSASNTFLSSSKLKTTRNVTMDDFVREQDNNHHATKQLIRENDFKGKSPENQDDLSPPPWMIPKEDADLDPSLSATASISLLVISKELSKTLFVRRRAGGGGYYSNFISNYLTTEAAWLHAWPQVLKQIVVAQQQGRSNTAMEMGVAMIMTMSADDDKSSKGITTLGQIVAMQHHEATDKKVLLGTVLFVSHVVRENQLNISYQQLGNILLPELVQIVQESSTKRTVLAHESMVAAYGLLSTTPTTIGITDDTTNRVTYLHSLLSVHEQWLNQKTKRDWRTECTRTVLGDWHQVLLQISIESPFNDSDATLGSIRQSLFDPQPLPADDIIAALDQVLPTEGAMDQQQHRSILRGVLAVFGRDRRVWRNEDNHANLLITKLLPILLDDCAKRVIHPETQKLCSSLLIFLLQAASVPERRNELVALVFDHLENKPDMASRIGEPWRTSLLLTEMVDDERYASVLGSICTAMFAAPQQMAPLFLFGRLVDAKNSRNTSNPHRDRRVSNGVLAVLTLCTEQMDKNQDSEKKDGNHLLYQKLAPLLLLRRIPTAIYQDVWKSELHDATELQTVLTKLATLIGTLILHVEDATTGTFPAERKLATEIAGLCLPFSVVAPYSAFTRIVRPAFQTLAIDIATKGEDAPISYHASNRALYIACCQVSLGDESSLLAVASFCLWLLHTYNNDIEDDDDGLISCRAGCVEFFAVCLKTERTAEIADALKQVLCNAPVEWLDVSLFDTTMSQEDLKYPSLKMSVWNSYLLVSQRTSEQGDALSKWACRTAPWLMDWLDYGHTMGAAQALQVLFVLISRTQSLNCIGDGDDQLQRINQCITRNLESKAAATRLAALKLLIRVVTLNVDAYEALGKEGDDTFTIVVAAAELDPDFQELANYLLSC